MVKQEVIIEFLTISLASLLALTSAFGDVSLMHPLGAGGMIVHDIDTPDSAYISASPYGGGLLHKVDLGDSYYGLGGAFRSPIMNTGLNVLPPYNVGASRRSMSYPVRMSRRYGRSRRMRLVPV